jgi:hypothetical protein
MPDFDSLSSTGYGKLLKLQQYFFAEVNRPIASVVDLTPVTTAKKYSI